MASIDNSFLSEQIDLLNKILAASTDYIYVYDRAGRYVYASPAGLAVLGLQAGDVVGKSWRELNLPAEVMERHDAQRESVFQTGIPVQGETSFPTVQEVRYYEYVLSPVLGKDGEIEAVINTSRDITERKQAENALRLLTEELEARVLSRTQELVDLNESLRLEIAERQKAEQALKESESRFSALIDAMFEGIVIQEHGTIIDANLGFATMFGYSLEEVIGKSAVDFLTPESLERVLRNTASQYEQPYEITGIRKDGTLIDLEVVGKQSLYQGRHVRVSAARDITERKRAETALRENQTQIQQQLAEIETIYQSAPIGLNVLDTDLRFVRINQRLADMNGFSVEAHIGRTVRELLPDLADAADQLLRPILETGEPLLNVEITGETPAQPGMQRTWLESFLPLKHGDRVIGISTVCEEITERKRAEVERLQLLQQEQAARAEVETLLRQLEAEQSRLEQILQQMPVGVSIAEAPSGKLTYHNDEAVRLLRHPLLDSETYQEYVQYGAIHADGQPYQPEEYPIARSLLSGEVIKAEEMPYRRGDGTMTLLSVSAAPIFDQDGQVIATVSTFEDISDRKQAEQTLAKELLRIRTLFTTSFDGIVILDREGYVIEANPRFAEMLGYHPEEMAKLSIFDWEADFTPQELRQIMDNYISQGSGVLETRHRRKDGSIYHVEISFSVVEWEGEILRFCVCRDMSDRKRAEQELQSVYDSLNFALAAAEMGTWDLDLIHDRARRNLRHDQIFGYDTLQPEWGHEIAKRHALPEDLPRFEEGFQQGLRTGELQFEARVLWPDQSLHWINVLGRVYYDEQHQPVRLAGVVMDITDRKQAEADLRESQERYRTLVQNFPNGAVFLFDHDLRYVLAEGQGLADVGLDRTMLEGQVIEDVLDPETWQLLKPHYEGALAGHPSSAEVSYSDRIYSVHLLPVSDDQGVVRLGMVMTQDITLQKQAEQILRTSRDELERQVQERTRELRQLTDELQRSNQELEQFAYVASHDLQEPLRAITSFTQLLAKRYRGQLDAKADTYIEFIVDGAIRMQQLVRDLLAYSRVGRYELSMQSVDCNALLERVKKDLQVAIAENQAIITADPLPTITADPNQMANLLQNLISNSLKYRTEPAPRIHISAKIISADVKHASGQGHPPHSATPVTEWLFSIQDNGIGIEPKYAERIFGIFQRLHTNDEYSGTGLGLAICRKIVERHEGHIWVESQLGQGATFFFSIPIPISTQHDTPHQITQTSAD